VRAASPLTALGGGEICSALCEEGGRSPAQDHHQNHGCEGGSSGARKAKRAFRTWGAGGSGGGAGATRAPTSDGFETLKKILKRVSG